MLINGEDGSPYQGGDLGFFKSVLSGVKKVGTTTVKVATLPARTVVKGSLAIAKPIVGSTLAMVVKPFTAGQAVQETSTAPACGFFQKIARAFGGSPNCQ